MRGIILIFIFLLIVLASGIATYIRTQPVSANNAHAAILRESLPVQATRFEKAFANLIKEEGGYCDHPNDKGGETKYGISKRSYPHLDIKNLTLDQAKEIYKKDFWLPIHGDELPSDELACEALEQSVNMGIKTAVSFMQVVCVAEGSIDMVVDGKMGKQTLQALNRIAPSFTLVAIRALAIAHYLKLAREEPPMKVFLKGWIKRVTS